MLFFLLQICPYESLSVPSVPEIKEMLEKLVVVKLNGGLGTSMGCKVMMIERQTV